MSYDSSIIVNTRGKNGVETKKKKAQALMKNQNYRNPYQYNNVCSTTPSAAFNYEFQMNVHQIQSPMFDTGEATALWKKFQKLKHNLSKISALFCNLFYSLSDMDFDMDSQEQANVKGSLHKNLQHWHHIDLALEETKFVKNSLTQCAFVINCEKSVRQPQKQFLPWNIIIYK